MAASQAQIKEVPPSQLPGASPPEATRDPLPFNLGQVWRASRGWVVNPHLHLPPFEFRAQHSPHLLGVGRGLIPGCRQTGEQCAEEVARDCPLMSL
jgi:hypothetical protein